MSPTPSLTPHVVARPLTDESPLTLDSPFVDTSSACSCPTSSAPSMGTAQPRGRAAKAAMIDVRRVVSMIDFIFLFLLEQRHGQHVHVGVVGKLHARDRFAGNHLGGGERVVMNVRFS